VADEHGWVLIARYGPPQQAETSTVIRRSDHLRALKRRLGEDANPEGLIESLRYAQGKLFRTRVVAEPAL